MTACFLSEPQATLQAAEALATDVPGEVSIEEIEGRERVGYWVYLPPLDDVEAAEARVEELRAEGIDDVAVVRAGPQQHAISLGIFSAEHRADLRHRQLVQRGVEAERGERYRVIVEYQVFVEIPGEQALPEAVAWTEVDCQTQPD